VLKAKSARSHVLVPQNRQGALKNRRIGGCGLLPFFQALRQKRGQVVVEDFSLRDSVVVGHAHQRDIFAVGVVHGVAAPGVEIAGLSNAADVDKVEISTVQFNGVVGMKNDFVVFLNHDGRPMCMSDKIETEYETVKRLENRILAVGENVYPIMRV
jgi:hypothetical protein